jgi:RNase adapter protein RapZ
MNIVIVTGISGSGKSVALNVLEDAGYFCIDNLPADLLVSAAHSLHERGAQRLAVAIDARSGTMQAAGSDNTAAHDLLVAITQLQGWALGVKVLFLSASTPTLIARFSETRRKHPLSTLNDQNRELTLDDCIAMEREWMSPLAGAAHVLDTSGLSVAALRHSVRQFALSAGRGLNLTFTSFGFKHGIPQEADVMFDARCLPNPHYESSLKALTGLDQPVMDYLKTVPAVGEFIEDIAQFLAVWLPRYEQDGRNYLTVAIGCTGGQHRSVYVAQQLAQRFAGKARVVVRHRQQAGKLESQ